MSESGRYWVVVQDAEGRTRKFCVEPLRERNQKQNDVAFRNGGLDGNQIKNAVKGGAIDPEDSIINAENGFTSWVTLPPGVSPEVWINERLKQAPDSK